MSRFRFLLVAAFTALGGVCFAAPMTVKEVDFLVRMKTPDAEIVRELTTRRLIAPLDAAGEQQLSASGASAGLIAQIKSGAYTLAPEQARTETLRQDAAREAAVRQAREAEANAPAGRPKAAARSSGGGTTRSWLQDFLSTATRLPFDPAKIGSTCSLLFTWISRGAGCAKVHAEASSPAHHDLKRATWSSKSSS